uniref:Uncharacterized protein n=1 Tax=Anguilla anguilla TaxID=7936 RepID=A0A0E9U242_ANGAN
MLNISNVPRCLIPTSPISSYIIPTSATQFTVYKAVLEL